MNEPLTWQDLYELLARSWPQVRVDRDRLPPDLPGWIRASTLEQNSAADRACNEFRRTGTWDPCEGEARTLLCLRVALALECVISRHQRNYPGPGEHAPRYLEEMLTSLWYHEAIRWADLHFSGPWSMPFDPWKL